jgi:uncharacterized protein with HEPN domain
MKDKELIQSLIKHCENITNYLKSVKNYKEFQSNQEKVDSILYNFVQIGEKTKKLDSKLLNNNPEIKVKDIIGLRNIITHDYEGITLEKIYLYSKKTIPIFKTQLLKLLND